MVSLLENLTPSTYKEIFSEWLSIIRRRECGSILHLPKRDQLYRIHAFLEDKKTHTIHHHYDETHYILLDLTAETIDDPNDLAHFVSSHLGTGHKRPVLFVLDADKLIDEKPSLLASLNNLYYTVPGLSILYFFGKNITHPSLSATLSSYTTLFQNISIFPYLEKKDSMYFIRYLERKLEFTLPDSLAEKIAESCGGISWLIKEACRYYAKTQDLQHILNHEELTIKTRILVDELMPEEKKVLEKIIKHTPVFDLEERVILQYLIRTRTIQEINGAYYFNAPVLEQYVTKQLSEKMTIEILNDRDMLINGILMNNYFSKRERRFLFFLLNNKNKLVSRNDSAECIWKNSKDPYTDWALDQFIRRIRKKLISLGFEKNIIKTLKNQGFVFS